MKKMGYAAVLTFNKKLENMVYDIWNQMQDFGVDLRKLGSLPHVTLAAFPDVDPAELIKATKRFTHKAGSIPIQFGSFGGFATEERVLFLSPVITIDLLKLHGAFFKNLGRLSKATPYKPGHWIPHCTVAMNIPKKDYARAAKKCLKLHLPISGMITHIEILKYLPVEKIERFPFLSPKKEIKK
jgi:2'-5' RNA ligase